MGELVERTSNVIASTVGNIINPAVAALMAASGIATGNQELALAAIPSGALAGALAEEGVTLVRRAWQDKADRVNHFAQTASKEAGAPIEELIERAAEDASLRELLARTVDSAARTYDTAKIEILAKAFVRGAEDIAEIDDMLVLVDLVHDLEVPHIRVLAALWRQAKDYADRLGHANMREGLTGEQFHEYDRALNRVVIPLQRALEEKHMVEMEILPAEGSAQRKTVTKLTALGRYLAEALEAVGLPLSVQQRTT